ncbi:MAG: glycosyltransferase [Lachnospiraceae bacterium]
MKIAAVIVTYNRLEDLKRALSSYSKQLLKPEYLIVVNNASTDGTKKYLQEWETVLEGYKKIVITMDENTGGSGGFYRGMQEVLKTDCEWCWIADDDAFVEEKTFSALAQFVKKNQPKVDACAALCSSVINHGVPDLWHRRKVERGIFKFKQTSSQISDYDKEYFEVNMFTYVGACINMKALKKAGLPIKDLFIYYDDLEHSYRLSKSGKIYCVPSAKVIHDSREGEETVLIDWRYYFKIKNSLYFYKKHAKDMFAYFALKRIVKNYFYWIMRKYTVKEEVEWQAFKDACKEKLGISEKYQIGWKG